jgi:hypothetical protein
MRLAFDLDTRRIVDPDNLTTLVTSIKARRGEVIPFDVRIARGGEVIQLEGATVSAYITPRLTFGTLIASKTGITGSGAGIETIYSGELDLDESAVNTLFATATTLSVEASLEIRVTDSPRSYRSEPVLVTIQNSYTAA